MESVIKYIDKRKNKKDKNNNIHKNRYKNINRTNRHVEKKYLILFNFLISGIILGIVYSFIVDKNTILDTKNMIIESAKYISNVKSNNNIMWFINVIYENIKLILLIAFLGLFTNLIYCIPCIILIKGFMYSFSISIVIKIMQITGLKLIAFSYVPFAILYIMLNILFAKVTIEYMNEKNVRNNKITYLIKFLLILILVIIISLIEIKVVPNILKIIIK